jgi:thiopeptide-type bacteriocin biosynthesis protein
LRLRFYGEELAESLEPELVTWLQAVEQSTEIRGFRFGIYEPETARFGGSAGMAVAHEQFDRESRTAGRYEMLSESERGGLPRDLFSLFLTNDLFARSLDDRAEIWDVWQKVGRLVRGSVRASIVSQTECSRARDVVTLEAAFTNGLSSSATALLEQASADNAYVAQRLRAIASSGRLHIGLRSWLATAAVFHWNRLGLTDVEIGAMTATMNCLLNPHENES